MVRFHGALMNKEQIKKIIEEEVRGVWVAEHNETGHHYRHTPTGLLVDSVTTKLIADKPHLVKWAVKKGIEWLEVNDRFLKLATSERGQFMIGAQEAFTEFRDQAGSVGSLAHAVAENYINYRIKNGRWPDDIRKGFKEGADPRSIASARSVEAMIRKIDIVPIASELLVGSVKHKIAGTLDLLALVDNELTLIDLKTSNQVSDEYANQIAAYKFCFEEMTGLKIKKAQIWHLSKDYDKCTVYNIPNLSSAYKAYKAIATYYDWLHNGKEKLTKDVKKVII